MLKITSPTFAQKETAEERTAQHVALQQRSQAIQTEPHPRQDRPRNHDVGVFNLWLSRPIGLIPFLFLPRGERCPRLVRCEAHVPWMLPACPA
jgi:hypothetical protein